MSRCQCGLCEPSRPTVIGLERAVTTVHGRRPDDRNFTHLGEPASDPATEPAPAIEVRAELEERLLEALADGDRARASQLGVQLAGLEEGAA